MAKKNYCENVRIAFEHCAICLVLPTDVLNSGILLVIFRKEVSEINWCLITVLYCNNHKTTTIQVHANGSK
jgi:hypothetical protein